MSTSRPVTGQYECQHRSGVGLDYFTARLDRLTLLTNGRFSLTTQDRSRLANAAQSLLNGQQASVAAPETRREGGYTVQGRTLQLRFDDGTTQQGELAWNGDGLQLDKSFFNKVSDSTLLPPTHRLKKDMDDIAKGLKIAGTIGGMAIKAAKTIQDTLQTNQTPSTQQAPQAANVQQQPPGQNAAPAQTHYAPPQPVAPMAAPEPAPNQTFSNDGSDVETLFCDQCGAPARSGKRFCNNCGAQLP